MDKARRLLWLAVPLAALVAAPAHASHASDEVAEVFLRIFLDGITQPAPQPQTPPTPPDPEVVIQADPTARLKDQEVSYLSPSGQPAFLVRDFKRSFITLMGGPATDATSLVVQDQVPDPAAAVSVDLDAAIARHYGTRDIG